MRPPSTSATSEGIFSKTKYVYEIRIFQQKRNQNSPTKKYEVSYGFVVNIFTKSLLKRGVAVIIKMIIGMSMEMIEF